LPDSEGNRPSDPPREITQLTEGIELIKRWEGLELNAYPDPATNGEPYTIGYGCTRHNDGTPIQRGETITTEQATSMLIHQIEQDFLPSLQRIPHWSEMMPYQKGALLSYAWNMGAGFVGDRENFATINRALDAKDWDAIPKAFMLYVKGGGRVMLGLKRRRHSEAALWQGQTASAAYQAGVSIVA
jgi:lysozyme